MLRRFLAIVGSVAALLGCAEPTSSVAISRSAILGGGGSGPADDGIVRLAIHFSPDIAGTCSATMVAPNLALTARHCVADYVDGVFQCTESGDLVDDGSGAGRMFDLRPADSVEFHVGRAPDIHLEAAAYGKEIFAPHAESLCRNDIAFVLLERSIDVPAMAVRLDTPTRTEEVMRLVGYGLSEAGFGVRHSLDGMPVLAVGASEFLPDGRGAPPRTFAVGRGPCGGDSGGPALSTDDAVTGVFSFSTPADCTVDGIYNFYTQLAPFAPLAREAFAAANAEPWLEGDRPPWDAGGAAGAGGGSAGEAGAAGAGGGMAGAAGASVERPEAAGAAGASAGRASAAGAGGGFAGQPGAVRAGGGGAAAGQPAAGGPAGARGGAIGATAAAGQVARGGAIGAGAVAGQGAGPGGGAGGPNIGAGGDAVSARPGEGAKDDAGCTCGLARSRDAAWWWVIPLLVLGGLGRRAIGTELPRLSSPDSSSCRRPGRRL